jgi:hypothetical protein
MVAATPLLLCTCTNHPSVDRDATFRLLCDAANQGFGLARRAAMVDHLSLRKRGVFVNLPICRIPRGSDFYLLLASEFVVETWTGSCGLVNTYVLLHLGYSGHVFLFHSLS